MQFYSGPLIHFLSGVDIAIASAFHDGALLMMQTAQRASTPSRKSSEPSPESHRFLAKVPAPRRRDTPLPAFRKMRVQASGNLFPAYQKRGEPDRRQMDDM